MTKNNTATPLVDWRAGHGPLTGTLNATAGTLAVTALAQATGTPEWWPLAAGVAGAAGTIGAGLRRAVTRLTLTYRSACWLAAGTWSSWALASQQVTTPTGLAALACTGIVAGTLAPACAAHEETEQARRSTLLMLGQRRALAAEWIDRLERVCGITGARIPAIEHWSSGAGYTVEIELPEGGVTRGRVRDRAEALASDLDLPTGGGITVRDGVSRRRLLVDVRTKSLAGTEIAFPMEEMAQVETINNPVPIGLRPDGERIEIDLRQASTLVAGTTGTGKTNWLHTLIARLNQCNDVLVWVIDFNGGSLALPWLHAWREAQTSGDETAAAQVPAPGVDWVASTPAEAERMLTAAVRIAKARKVAYQEHMRAEDDDKLPVDGELPEIVILVDESAEVAHTREAKRVLARLSEVIRIARAMAVRAVVSALRVTQDVLPDPMVRKMASNRVCTGATEDSELGHFFGWRALSAEEVFDGPGSLLVGTNGRAPHTGRGWRITPSTIEAVCRATATRRPTLDGPSLEAAGDAYAERWTLERCGHLWADTRATATAGPSSNRPSPSNGSTPREWKHTADWDKPRSIRTPDPAELEAMFNAPSADKHAPPQEGGGPEEGGGFDAADPTTWKTRRKEPEVAAEYSEARQAALRLLIAAGPDGTGASAIARKLADFGTSRQTVVGWLKEWVRVGEAVRVGEGTKARYVHRQHAPDNDSKN